MKAEGFKSHNLPPSPDLLFTNLTYYIFACSVGDLYKFEFHI